MSETKEALEQEVAALEARVAELKVLNELRDRVAALKAEIDRLSGATEASPAPCLLPHYPHWCARRHVDDPYPPYPTQPWVTWCGTQGEAVSGGTFTVKAGEANTNESRYRDCTQVDGNGVPFTYTAGVAKPPHVTVAGLDGALGCRSCNGVGVINDAQPCGVAGCDFLHKKVCDCVKGIGIPGGVFTATDVAARGAQ